MTALMICKLDALMISIKLTLSVRKLHTKKVLIFQLILNA
jgi:hypothetical protein